MTSNHRRSPGGRRILAFAAVGTAALVLAAGCGDDGESASNPFCDDFKEFDDKWKGKATFEDFAAGKMDEADLQEVISDLRSMDPPEELANEWPTFVDTLETIGSSESQEEAAANLEDPADIEAVQTVQTYVNEQCTDAS